MSEGIATLVVTNPLGMILHVPVAGLDDAYTVMRTLGGKGWTSGSIPSGGIILPYRMADTFDWSLIGARWFSFDKDGETVQAVDHGGHVYTRRDFDAVTKGKKMPAKVKYSRGAKPTDPEHLKEGATGDNAGYVTLIQFVGNGDPVRDFEKPRARPQYVSAAQPAAAQDRPPQGAQGLPKFDPFGMLDGGERRRLIAKAKAKKIDYDTDAGAARFRTLVGSVTGGKPLERAQIAQFERLLEAQQAS